MTGHTTYTTGRVAGRRAWALGIAALTSLVLGAAACSHIGHVFGRSDVEPPPEEAFGYGPRVSTGGTYTARVEPLEPVRVRRMHGWRLELENGDGSPVTGAEIRVDGGMPQHGHGLPTQPRVTRELGDGAYEVQGVRFNMGGWWVVTFHITTATGTDSVTFNLAL